MIRTEAIAIITANLPNLDDAAVTELAEHVKASTTPFMLRDLTDDELAAIERSRQDFKAGRTSSADEYRDEMHAFMATLEAKHQIAQ